MLVSQARSSVCNAYSPKAISVLRVALPARLPRCVLRYLTLLGINGIGRLLSPQDIAGAAGVPAGGLGSRLRESRSRLSRSLVSFSGACSGLQIQHFTPILP